MAKIRYLTKSRFKVGHECATKLFYEGNPEFASDKLDDQFLKSLADGGLQVGALSQLYFPQGFEVTETEHDAAVAKTLEYLKQDQVILFEAAFRYENLFIRVDILKKNGKFIELIEVKAKGYKKGETSFFKKSGEDLDSSWEPFIADIAFQTYVSKKAFPEYTFTSFLMLADQNKVATVDGLHQKFLLNSTNGRSTVVVAKNTTLDDLGDKILTVIPVDQEVNFFLNQSFNEENFEFYVNSLSLACSERKWIPPKISRHCGNCEFKVARKNLAGKKSGFEKCWTAGTLLEGNDFEKPLIFDLWALDYRIKDRLISESRYFLDDIEFADLIPKKNSHKSEGLARFERQWKQIELQKSQSKLPYFDSDRLLTEIKSWAYPLHFIDFETITSAIPFTKGMTPYETVAFQFSHHEVTTDGKVRHKTQFLSIHPGDFPNFQFVRALKKAIGDHGTILRYATHENTVLRHIKKQLLNSTEDDQKELIDFIDSITIEKNKNGETLHHGSRAMVDLLELVKNFYLSPLMGGSNSIKVVLPSILSESQFLKNKYSKPIYGNSDGIFSHNFKNKIWVQDINGKIKDPYKTLDPIFKDVNPQDLANLDRITELEGIREGGSASVAYARMQLSEMSDSERQEIAQALLSYCELDTLAMVMIYESWMDLLFSNL